jgi:hypothetical protein
MHVMSSYDSPWKEALYHHLRQLLSLLFPRLAEEIDWSKDYHPLEQELRQLFPEAEVGLRQADALIRVRLKSGDDRLLHAEVQAQKREEFPRRVYEYNYRGFDHFREPPEALVILGDDDPDWRPRQYAVRLRYSQLTFEFEPVKLLDWVGRKQELLDNKNPMGLFVVAHLEAQRTHGDEQERARVKLDLLLRLAARRLDEDETRQWYRYLDWFLNLPPDLNRATYAQARSQTLERGMPFVTEAEKYGRELGYVEGQLRVLLEMKFQQAGRDLMPEIYKINELQRVTALLQIADKATSIEEVRAAITQAPTNNP